MILALGKCAESELTGVKNVPVSPKRSEATESYGGEKMIRRLMGIACVWAVLLLALGTANAVTYTDNFDSGAQLPWGNQRGNWVASGGSYHAGSPSNSPVTASLLPYNVTDFTAEVDIHGLGDGGLWARTDATATSGVMLIIRGGDIYWHVITNPSSGPWDMFGYQGKPGIDVHVKLTGVGNILSAYLNGATSPITTLDLSTVSRPGYDYSSGQFGLYSFSSMTFDNVSLTYSTSAVPEPATMLLLGCGIIGVTGLRRKFGK
jgi:hypothetical protein